MKLKNKDKDLKTDSTNIFAELGLDNPEERLVKAKLAMQINLIIKQRGLNQVQAAKLLETDQSKISALHKGKLSGFSLERLFRFLNILGQSISIKVTSKIKVKKTPDLSVNLSRLKRAPSSIQRNTAVIVAKKK